MPTHIEQVPRTAFFSTRLNVFLKNSMIYSLLDLITAAHYCHSGRLTVILQSLASLHCYRPAGTVSTEQFPTSSIPTIYPLTSFPGIVTASSLPCRFPVSLPSPGRCAAWILASVKSSIHHQYLPMLFLFSNTLPCLHLFGSLLFSGLSPSFTQPVLSRLVPPCKPGSAQSSFLLKSLRGKDTTQRKFMCRDSRHAEGNSTQEGRWGGPVRLCKSKEKKSETNIKGAD